MDTGYIEAEEQPKPDTERKPAAPEAPARRKSGARSLILWAVLACILLGGAGWYYFGGRATETTDDAQVDGNVVAIAPKVVGYVQTLAITDNQRVKAGDLLIRIDPRDYVASRDQAKAGLASAQAQLENAKVNLEMTKVTAPAKLVQAKAQVALATANRDLAAIDNRRQAQVDQAQAGVQQAQAQLATAELNLSYTEVRAPQDGWVTLRNVQLGSYVQAGQSLFSLVTPDVWITANFKENQIDRMRAGQKVDIRVDAYGDLRLHGHIDSIQLGTGSRFSAFPAENATGNYVKIVQRIPVKIAIDSGLDPTLPLPLGASVDPTVNLQ
jgi:membrane fusion protein (multidrug efflux system)